MKHFFFVSLILTGLWGCSSGAKIYEYIIENHLTKPITIIPITPQADFWISSDNAYIILPQNKAIIGSYILYNDNKKATNIYKPEDTIVPFEVYINNIKQEKDFTKMALWTFSLGSVDESGKYTLIINETSFE